MCTITYDLVIIQGYTNNFGIWEFIKLINDSKYKSINNINWTLTIIYRNIELITRSNRTVGLHLGVTQHQQWSRGDAQSRTTLQFWYEHFSKLNFSKITNCLFIGVLSICSTYIHLQSYTIVCTYNPFIRAQY